MTNGRSGKFKTTYGTIEFIHTNRELGKLESDIYFDGDIGIHRATEARAIADLRRVGRNTHLLEN